MLIIGIFSISHIFFKKLPSSWFVCKRVQMSELKAFAPKKKKREKIICSSNSRFCLERILLKKALPGWLSGEHV